MPGTEVYDPSPASRHARWYLRPDVIDRPMSYLDFARERLIFG
jgi:hypothetical protein